LIYSRRKLAEEFSRTTATETDRKLTIVNPQNIHDPTPSGYSTAGIIPAGARVAYLSGHGAKGALSSDFAGQVEQAYANLRTAIDPMPVEVEAMAMLPP
jgi:hypothetical protein